MREESPKFKEWKKKHPEGKPELSWHVGDYDAWDYEIPERLTKYPTKTEGELMDQEEMETWVADAFRVLSVVKEENAETFKELHKDFIQDLEYLVRLKKLDSETLDEIKDINIFDF